MKHNPLTLLISILFLSSPATAADGDEPINISGVFPHLRMWNSEGECGTGAVVPWQDRLWAITYAPHAPEGSDDKLYQITPDLTQIIFEGSVGGTPANRLIHRESNQLLIGPYQIDANRNIRVLPPSKMFGRLTGTSRHLTDPAEKVYHATMEQGLYEVNVNTGDVKCWIRDRHKQAPPEGIVTRVPGAHGKGLYTGQNRVVYSNNGEKGAAALKDPTVTSGALVEWFGEGDWQLVKRAQFTEISGPGGIYGNADPDNDPLWALGWDSRSVLLALLDAGEWSFYRLPKGSHSYDGAHGWNTEWPRIREIGEEDLLATMHGTFWRFPPAFSRNNSGGIAPRSNYLKVVGDFCRWREFVVLGCDDSAKNEFLNTRPFKAEHGAPRQSNSNLWFLAPERIDQLGPSIGRGSVWLREKVPAETPSDPYLFSGFDHRMLCLTHRSESPVNFRLEVDEEGNDTWKTLRKVRLDPNGTEFLSFGESDKGAWIRLVSEEQAENVTAHFHYRNRDPRPEENAPIFSGIASSENPPASRGLMRSLAYDRLGLVNADLDLFELSTDMTLKPLEAPASAEQLVKEVAQPTNAFVEEESSLLVIEDGKRYRLPRNSDFSSEAVLSSEGETLVDFLPTSLTRGARVTVSSTHGDFLPEYAVDGVIGDDDRRWISTKDSEGWIELDLGLPKTIAELWLLTGWKGDSAYVAKQFDLGYHDGVKWIDECRVVDNPSGEWRYTFPEPVTTQTLRIRSRTDDHLRVYEIAAFSEALNIEKDHLKRFPLSRVCREVATERDLLNLHGTFYELPARNAQGLAKVRPIATHNLRIHDFCSHNGLLLFTGLTEDAEGERIFRSQDGGAAFWAGVIDDLWHLGKPRGRGGPWSRSRVEAGKPSDPYLMTGFDRKSFELESSRDAKVTIEVDIDGTDLWVPYRTFPVTASKTVRHSFPENFSAYWVRAVSDTDSEITVTFIYE